MRVMPFCRSVLSTASPESIEAVQARGGELAWKSMHKHLLEPLGADLAIMFTNAYQPTVLNEMAQYVWTVPEYEDWGEVFDEIARQCPNDTDRMPWRRLCEVPSQFLGGIAGCNHHPASAGTMLIHGS